MTDAISQGEWKIRVPYRNLSEPLATTASLCRTLGGEDAAVSRELCFEAMTAGYRTAGELVAHLEGLSQGERRRLLDATRERVGLPSTADAEFEARMECRSHRAGDGLLPGCAVPGCANVPTRGGAIVAPMVKRWWCPEHVHLAAPGDMEPPRDVLRVLPSGAPPRGPTRSRRRATAAWPSASASCAR